MHMYGKLFGPATTEYLSVIYKIGLDEPNLILVLHILCIGTGTLPLRSIEFSKIINLICIASEERRQ